MASFIVPCSCPSFLIVNFITENLEKANHLLEQYKGHKEIEKVLHKKCLSELGLLALDKDDCITPKPMITFCENLLKNRDLLKKHLIGTRLTVTNYYSVMTDGQMYIPWNWKLK
uniref:T-cell activation inhibitor, mitochondrial isoform x2 n=1 Tax=Triatoma infestans TaxID=30076 RepID=A0A161MFN5_TRIIF